jgi:hypothetical protein
MFCGLCGDKFYGGNGGKLICSNPISWLFGKATPINRFDSDLRNRLILRRNTIILRCSHIFIQRGMTTHLTSVFWRNTRGNRYDRLFLFF